MKLSITKRNQSEGDYSGLDVANRIFSNVDLHESVFNGSYFTEVQFVNCDLRHTEFTEAKFSKCIFTNCNLDYSDFVFLNASETLFTGCSFSHVEWRENNFVNLHFVGCSFTNSTISLCSFVDNVFDDTSSSNFCGATKRYNVFSRSYFELLEDKVEFLMANYGIIRPDTDSKISLTSKNKQDNFLSLSVSKYFNDLNTLRFVNLIVKISDDLSSKSQKNHLQKIKYLILICRLTAEENTISVFGIQLLINALNSSARKITESLIFMELLDLIMFLKTHQYKKMKEIELEVSSMTNEYADIIISQCVLDNTYDKKDVIEFTKQLSDFLGIPRKEISVRQFRNGSTIFEFIIKCSASIGGFLLFINFALSQVHKTINYAAKIKKNIKYLKKKGKGVKDVTKNAKDENLAIVPFAIMSNEGNVYYTQVNNIIDMHGNKLIKIDGKGQISIEVKQSKVS